MVPKSENPSLEERSRILRIAENRKNSVDLDEGFRFSIQNDDLAAKLLVQNPDRRIFNPICVKTGIKTLDQEKAISCHLIRENNCHQINRIRSEIQANSLNIALITFIEFINSDMMTAKKQNQ